MQRSYHRNTRDTKWQGDKPPPKDHNSLTIEWEDANMGKTLHEDFKSLLVKMMRNLKEDAHKQMNSRQVLTWKSAT